MNFDGREGCAGRRLPRPYLGAPKSIERVDPFARKARLGSIRSSIVLVIVVVVVIDL